ncbi:hypothetical protein GCM10016455_05640 [Aliiroseovarius zhejiangensis]|uniref:Uncharacterized protein n=1 Tax=Aliiroseovarius zhejiangensis TaxID=1632025 RepID=A0ABQ3IMY5_9RHOB|nr:hypothetical protein [Aliiroseovarius zhejiangensis]GHE88380.1 hypothetical protein GCM10016455_05640 [Aliiroseovarius zhejiangensis]
MIRWLGKLPTILSAIGALLLGFLAYGKAQRHEGRKDAREERAQQDAQDHIETRERIEDAVDDDRDADWRDRLRDARK